VRDGQVRKLLIISSLPIFFLITCDSPEPLVYTSVLYLRGADARELNPNKFFTCRSPATRETYTVPDVRRAVPKSRRQRPLFVIALVSLRATNSFLLLSPLLPSSPSRLARLRPRHHCLVLASASRISKSCLPPILRRASPRRLSSR
jgi:hypothetical protein